jgi:hypothetical protein
MLDPRKRLSAGGVCSDHAGIMRGRRAAILWRFSFGGGGGGRMVRSGKASG